MAWKFEETARHDLDFFANIGGIDVDLLHSLGTVKAVLGREAFDSPILDMRPHVSIFIEICAFMRTCGRTNNLQSGHQLMDQPCRNLRSKHCKSKL
jgi:hypothetical protein